jgi:hypothetical protein
VNVGKRFRAVNRGLSCAKELQVRPREHEDAKAAGSRAAGDRRDGPGAGLPCSMLHLFRRVKEN